MYVNIGYLGRSEEGLDCWFFGLSGLRVAQRADLVHDRGIVSVVVLLRGLLCLHDGRSSLGTGWLV